MNRYVDNHQNRKNLAIHLVAVPLFVLGHIAVIYATRDADWLGVVGSVMLIVLSLATQGRGHKLENQPPEPFSSPLNFIARIYAEQFYRFWRFLLSEDFRKAWKG